MRTTVVNLRVDKFDEYIGRAGHGHDGYFGNPFLLSRRARGATIRSYRAWFLKRIETDQEFRRRVLALRGKRLGCFCKPHPCHGDVIVEWLDQQTITARQRGSSGAAPGRCTTQRVVRGSCADTQLGALPMPRSKASSATGRSTKPAACPRSGLTRTTAGSTGRPTPAHTVPPRSLGPFPGPGHSAWVRVTVAQGPNRLGDFICHLAGGPSVLQSTGMPLLVPRACLVVRKPPSPTTGEPHAARNPPPRPKR